MGPPENVVPSEYIVDAEGLALPPGFASDTTQKMTGKWMTYGVNKHFSAMYYASGGHFGPHRDSHVHLSYHEQSLLTVAIYLNDRSQDAGVATNFLSDNMEAPRVDPNNRAPESSIIASVSATKAGKAVIFHHDLLHEGGTLAAATVEPKWLLVTQVLYRRTPRQHLNFPWSKYLRTKLWKKQKRQKLTAISQTLYKQAYPQEVS